MKLSIKVLIVVLALAVMPSHSFAQSQLDVQRAKAQLWAAQDAFDGGDYSNALAKVEAAEEAMGSAGEPTLLLKVKSLYELQRYEDAKKALEELYTFSPSESTQRAVSPILLDIDERIARQLESERLEKERMAEVERLEIERLAEEERQAAEQRYATRISEAEAIARKETALRELEALVAEEQKAESWRQNRKPLWSKLLGDLPYGTGISLALTSGTNGSVFVAAKCGRGSRYLKTSLCVHHLNGNGEIVWERDFQGKRPFKDKGGLATHADNNNYSIFKNIDGGVIVGWNTRFSKINKKNVEVYLEYNLMRLSAEGKQVWIKSFKLPDDVVMSKVIVSEVGSIFLGGSFGPVTGKPYLIKLDNNGKLIWEKSYDGLVNQGDSQYMTLHHSGGVVILTGKTGSSFLTNSLTHLDSEGEVVWRNEEESNISLGYGVVVRNPEGGFFTFSRKNDATSFHKVSALGESQEIKAFKEILPENMFSAISLSNGKALLIGDVTTEVLILDADGESLRRYNYSKAVEGIVANNSLLDATVDENGNTYLVYVERENDPGNFLSRRTIQIVKTPSLLD